MSDEISLPYELPAVTAPSLDDLRVEVMGPVLPTGEELILRLHARLREKAPTRERKVGEPIEMGDDVECDILTLVHGKVVPGSIKQAARMEMREFLHLPGFIEELTTMTTMSAKTFALVLPEDYPVPAIAGETATFYVEARRAFAIQMPELDDVTSLRAAGLGESIDEAMDVVAAEIDAEQGEELLVEATKAVLDALAKRVTATIPEAAIDEELRLAWQESEGAYFEGKSFPKEMVAQAQGDFLKDTTLRADARDRIAVGLALGALVEQEGLLPTDEKMTMLMETAAEATETSVQEVKKSLAREPLYARRAADTALYLVAVEFVMSRAVVDVLDPAAY